MPKGVNLKAQLQDITRHTVDIVRIQASQANRQYEVRFYDDRPPSCTCISYAVDKNRQISLADAKGMGLPIAATCKHLSKAQQKLEEAANVNSYAEAQAQLGSLNLED